MPEPARPAFPTELNGLSREQTERDDELVEKASALLGKKAFFDISPKKVAAYDTVAASFSKTRPNEQVFFERAVNAAWLAHQRGKGLSAPAIQSEDPQLPLAPLRELLETRRFKDAMERRGIPGAELEHLSTEMIAALTVLRDSSLMLPERVKLHKVGVSWEKFQGWLLYPPFRQRYREGYEAALNVATELSDLKLAELIGQGNMKAIEYSNAMTGKYDPAQREAVNTAALMSMVMSTVMKHVTDEVALRELSGAFRQLAAGNGLPDIVGQVVDAELVEEGDAEAPLI